MSDFPAENSPSRKSKFNLFESFDTREKASNAIASAAATALGLAAVQGAMSVVVYLLNGTDMGIWGDIVLLLIFGVALRQKKSRFVAVIFLAYTLVLLGVTFQNRIGGPGIEHGRGGSNIILGVIAVYGAALGVKGTFRLQAIDQSRLVWGSVLINTVLFLLYTILSEVILIAIVGLFFPKILADNTFFGELIILLALSILALVSLQYLPFTKRTVNQARQADLASVF